MVNMRYAQQLEQKHSELLSISACKCTEWDFHAINTIESKWKHIVVIYFSTLCGLLQGFEDECIGICLLLISFHQVTNRDFDWTWKAFLFPLKTW